MCASKCGFSDELNFHFDAHISQSGWARAGAAGMAEYLDDPHVRSSRPPNFGEESPGTHAHRVLDPLERRRD